MGCCTPRFEKSDLTPELSAKTLRHPCYSFSAHHKYARMHLSVAPACNISCNYCNRKFDCVNESRPGVTSEVLSPTEALTKFKMVREKLDNLSVVGIAGPGDALANWAQTKKTLQLIKEEDPEVIFCLSTNGLMLPDYAEEIVELGVNHVTVTMNSLDPVIGAQIYQSVNYRGKTYHSIEGASILLERQLEGIKRLTELGVLVKINIVMIKGVNDSHIPDVVRKAGELGVFISNIMPLIPAEGSAFEDFPQTSTKELVRMRSLCQLDLKQMNHCRQCRADAIGMLGRDCSQEFRLKTHNVDSSSAPSLTDSANSSAVSPAACSSAPSFTTDKVYKIAVASKGGLAVDQHFGYASEFQLYQVSQAEVQELETRPVTKYCSGVEYCDTEDSKDATINALSDCDAVLSLRIGYHAKERLKQKGIVSIETCDKIDEALRQTVKILSQVVA